VEEVLETGADPDAIGGTGDAPMCGLMILKTNGAPTAKTPATMTSNRSSENPFLLTL
jgi:hypothetical protein